MFNLLTKSFCFSSLTFRVDIRDREREKEELEKSRNLLEKFGKVQSLWYFSISVAIANDAT